jgi:ABC-type Mn2+/Zn2+ transport system permease subunit
VLVSALLVIPGATAAQVTDRYGAMFAVAIVVALFSTIGGLCISYYADLASGATIVTLAAMIFFIFLGIGKWRRGKS